MQQPGDLGSEALALKLYRRILRFGLDIGYNRILLVEPLPWLLGGSKG